MSSYGTPRPEPGICCGKTSGRDGWQVGVPETPGPAGAGGGAGCVASPGPLSHGGSLLWAQVSQPGVGQIKLPAPPSPGQRCARGWVWAPHPACALTAMWMERRSRGHLESLPPSGPFSWAGLCASAIPFHPAQMAFPKAAPFPRVHVH